MCKHIAAVLYGVGARLDHQPELLFRLRAVDEKDLIASAGTAVSLASPVPGKGKVLAGEDLADIFNIDMAAPEAAPLPAKKLASKKKPAVKKKPAAKKRK